MDELKERILKGVRLSPSVFVVAGSEIRVYFDDESLKQWASENALVHLHEQTLDEYLFSVSPSLAAIKAAEKGARKMAEILKSSFVPPDGPKDDYRYLP